MANSVVFRSQSADGWGGPQALGGTGKQIVGGENRDGRLELFYIGDDDNIYHTWETAPKGGWDLGANFGFKARQIALISNADGRLELFWIEYDSGRISHSWQTEPGGPQWQAATLDFTASFIDVVRNQDGRIELFFTDPEKNLLHSWQTFPHLIFSPAASLGGKAESLCAHSNQDGRLELFYIAPDAGIYHLWQKTENSSEYSAPVYLQGLAKSIVASHNADGRIEIFYVGSDDHIYHNWQTSPNGNWHGEQGFGGSARQMALAPNYQGRLELFYVGMDGFTYHNWQVMPNGAWGGGVRNSQAIEITALSRVADGGAIALFYLGSAEPPPLDASRSSNFNAPNYDGGASVSVNKDGSWQFNSSLSKTIVFNAIRTGWMAKGGDGVAYAIVSVFGKSSGTSPDLQADWPLLISNYNEVWTVTDDGRSASDIITDMSQKLGGAPKIVTLHSA